MGRHRGRGRDYLRQSRRTGGKNPFLRFFAHLLAGLISILVFWADNDGGIRCERCFKDINPFEIKKRFRLFPSENGIVEVHFSDPKYHPFDKSYDPPRILLTGDVTEEESEIYYDPKQMRSAYRTYNYPAFTVLFLLSAFVNWVGVMVSITVVMRIPTSSLFENIGGIAGVVFCEIILIGLLIAMLRMFIRSHKLYNEIDKNLLKQYETKSL